MSVDLRGRGVEIPNKRATTGEPSDRPERPCHRETYELSLADLER
jgi:hypothetical protein